MATHTHRLRAQGKDVTGVWSGGPYINLFFMWGNTRMPDPFTVINVWDYSTGMVSADFTSVKQAMIRWRDDLDERDIEVYWEETVEPYVRLLRPRDDTP